MRLRLPHAEIRELEYFLAVVDHGGSTRAAVSFVGLGAVIQSARGATGS
jgi:hypothetical protein